MKPVLSTFSTRISEAECMASVSEAELIERASLAIYSVLPEMNEYVVLAGPGNNGSDGISLAIRLASANRQVRVFYTGEAKSAENSRLRADALNAGIKAETLKSASGLTLGADCCVIDSMLGIGLDRPLKGIYAELAEKINSSECFVVSADIPTGLNSDTGETSCAVRADITVTFTSLKYGHLLGSGRNCCGEIKVMDIGIKPRAVDAYILEDVDAGLKKRLPASHKGNFNNVKIIAGSPEMMGASLLAHESALAALRGGAGYCSLCVPRSLAAVYQQRVKEEMLTFLPDENGRILFDRESLDKIMKSDVIVLGPGMGKNQDIPEIIRYISDNYSGVFVIDADGLNMLSTAPDSVKGHRCGLVLTPHIGEFRRLSGGDDCSPSAAQALAEKFEGIVVMKSASTFITDGRKSYINVTGTPAMAKGGSGDVLSGLLGAMADRSDLLLSAAKSCYIFGKAGEAAEKRIGSYSVLASDIIGIIKEQNGQI